MIKFDRMRSCLNTPPKQDGLYLVMRFDKAGVLYSAGTFHYTVKYGWNTYNCCPENPIIFEKEDLWTVATKIKTRRKAA